MKQKPIFGLILIFLFCIKISISKGQENILLNSNQSKIYESILSLDFKRADFLIENAPKNNNNDELKTLWLKTRKELLQYIVFQDKKAYNQNKNTLEERINIIEKIDGDEKLKYFVIANYHFDAAIIKFLFKDYIAGGIALAKSYNNTKEAREKYPDYIPYFITDGILNILIGSIPDEYKKIVNILGFKGSVNQGYELIHQYFNQNKSGVFGLESKLALAIAENVLNSDDKVGFEVISKFQLPKNNPLVDYLYARAAVHAGKSKIALDYLNESIQNSQNTHPFTYYTLATAKLYSDNESPIPDFNRFLTSFKGNNYVKTTYLRMSYYYLIKNDTLNYKKYLQKIIKSGDDFLDADKEAQSIAKKKQMPDVKLLKARLLFDGGYYNRALLELKSYADNYDNLPIEKKIEVNYRLARIFHETGVYKKALIYYALVLKTTASIKIYFAPNSALMIGNIYELQGKYQKAKEYYELCLSINNAEYKNSIEQKAKTGIDRVLKKL